MSEEIIEDQDRDSEFESEEMAQNIDEEEEPQELNEKEGSLAQAPPFKQTDIGLIAGKRGSGKTNLVLYLIDTFTKLGANIIIVDPVFDLRNNLAKINEQYGEKIVHVPYGNRKQFEQLLYKLMKEKWKGIIIADEADKFFPNMQKLSDIENYFIQIGRHHGIGLIAVTRRLAKMHTDLTSQANKLYMFKHWQRADIDYLRESNLGDYAHLLKDLEKYWFLYLDTDVEFVQVTEPVPVMK